MTHVSFDTCQICFTDWEIQMVFETLQPHHHYFCVGVGVEV
jgi:hypothetical protein